MLILTAKPGDTVYIGDDIEVRYLGGVGRQIRWGFKVPKHIRVDREIVHRRIEAEKALAAQA